MSELENLESKTDADLVQIAVAFGDFTPEEAATKSREELIGAISGILPAKKSEEAEAPAPKKRGRKKKADGEEPEQAKEEAPKKTRSSKKEAAKDTAVQRRPRKRRPKSLLLK